MVILTHQNLSLGMCWKLFWARLRYRIWGQIAWCGSASTSKIYFLLIHYYYPIKSPVCSFLDEKREFQSWFHICNNWNVALIAICRIFGRIFAALVTFSITNFTLIGYYLHYVNSSPLKWKPYHFVSLEKKQKILAISGLLGRLSSISGWTRMFS